MFLALPKVKTDLSVKAYLYQASAQKFLFVTTYKDSCSQQKKDFQDNIMVKVNNGQNK